MPRHAFHGEVTFVPILCCSVLPLFSSHNYPRNQFLFLGTLLPVHLHARTHVCACMSSITTRTGNTLSPQQAPVFQGGCATTAGSGVPAPVGFTRCALQGANVAPGHLHKHVGRAKGTEWRSDCIGNVTRSQGVAGGPFGGTGGCRGAGSNSCCTTSTCVCCGGRGRR